MQAREARQPSRVRIGLQSQDFRARERLATGSRFRKLRQRGEPDPDGGRVRVQSLEPRERLRRRPQVPQSGRE